MLWQQRSCLVWLTAAACNPVFGLDPTQTIDAAVDECQIDGVNPDEDVDGIANIVDNCPTVFNDGQEDGDGDRVGDACDPNRTSPGDSIANAAFFDCKFAPWNPDTGANWTLREGSAENINDRQLVPIAKLAAPPPAHVIEVVFTVDDVLRVPTTYVQIGVEQSYPNQQGRCAIHVYQDQELAHLSIAAESRDAQITLSSGSVQRLLLRRTAAEAQCSIGGANLAIPAGPTAGESVAAFVVDRSRVRIHSIVMYSEP